MFAGSAWCERSTRTGRTRTWRRALNRRRPLGSSDERRLWSVVGMGGKAARQHAADRWRCPLPGDGPFSRRSVWSRQGQRSCASIPRKSDLSHASELSCEWAFLCAVRATMLRILSKDPGGKPAKKVKGKWLVINPDTDPPCLTIDAVSAAARRPGVATAVIRHDRALPSHELTAFGRSLL